MHTAQRRWASKALAALAALLLGPALSPAQIVDRAELDLAGSWRFQPAAAPSPDDDAWGAARVPASWPSRGVVEPGRGEPWEGVKLGELGRAWYERDVDIPADWAGREVVLRLDRVSTDATVFMNGREMGVVNWPFGEVDVTDAVRPGEANTVRLLVVAVDDRDEVVKWMGYVEEATEPARLATRGLTRGVSIETRPAGGRIDDVFIRTSVREGTLSLDVELADFRPGAQSALAAEILDDSGSVVKLFQHRFTTPRGGDTTITASWPWTDPELWDVGRPNLYTLRLTVEGPGLADRVEQRFGFREFWIDGKDFYLNGTKIHLRPALISSDWSAWRDPKELLELGFNSGHIWPKDNWRRGIRMDDPDIYEAADEVGLLIHGNARHLSDAINKQDWSDPAVREAWAEGMERELKLRRNHPSVIMWGHSANAFQWFGDGNPRQIGREFKSDHQEFVIRRDKVLQGLDMIREVDPTRPIFAHHGADHGEVHTCNLYLNFLPMQDREEWLSAWAEDGEMPYMIVEWGLPLWTTLLRGRNGFGLVGQSEPFMTEWSASFLGAEAYQNEPQSYRDVITTRFQPDATDRRREYDPHIIYDRKNTTLTEGTAWRPVQDEFIIRTYRAWRTWGISGGMLPWDVSPQDAQALDRVNRETLAWLAGPPEMFTERPERYVEADAVMRQVVLINDSRDPADATWTLRMQSDDGSLLDERTGERRLEVGEIAMVPVRFRAPAVEGETRDVSISLEAKIGEMDHQDQIDLRIYAKQTESWTGPTLAVFDPEGETAAMLRELGCDVRPASEASPGDVPLVIGRKALSEHHGLPVKPGEFVRRGGRLLVMGQDPGWIERSLGMRTAPILMRRAFVAEADHPVLAGLDDHDLQNWRGESTLVEPYPHYPGYEWARYYGWRWGSRHTVTSAPVEIPHHGSWTPIIRCGFDLAYSPLLDLDVAGGRVTLCTLDLEDHAGIDPAAQKLARQLVEHVATTPLEPTGSTALYMGEDAESPLLDSIGADYQALRRLPTARTPGTVLIGPDANVDASRLDQLLSAGRTVVVLPRNHDLSAAGLTLAGAEDFLGADDLPAWGWVDGFAAHDLRWRAEGEAAVIESLDGGSVAADGLLAQRRSGDGLLVALQLDPDAGEPDRLRYQRFTRWRTTRVLTKALAELGVPMRADAEFLDTLNSPPFSASLAGEWQAALTNPQPEVGRNWRTDTGLTDAARSLIENDDTRSSSWQTVSVPAYMESYGDQWRFVDGEVVFRRAFDMPEGVQRHPFVVSIGRADESETTYVNGAAVGSSTHWLHPRAHRVEAGKFVPGRNVLAIRLWDSGIHGGLCGSPHFMYMYEDRPRLPLYHRDYMPEEIPTVESGESLDEAATLRDIADEPYRYYRW